VVLLSRTHRQSKELFRIIRTIHNRMDQPLVERKNDTELALTNASRILCLPCKEETIRGYSHVSLLVIDEAARIPDDLYRAVRPMLAVSRGKLICLSTPYGKRGFFHDAWFTGGADWTRIEVPASQISRITPAFLEEERRAMGETWYRQEYCCSFEAMEGLVYPDFARCVTAALPRDLRGKKVGGIDFGFRNPFAAIWGTHDHDGVLYLTGEHYVRGRPLSYHAAQLPRDVMWYADPAGAGDRNELLIAGFKVQPGDNRIRPGIAAVTGRLESGRLKVLEGRCPNLLAEAHMYRYDGRESMGTENPVEEHNHAMDALRYLICGLDARRMGQGGGPNSPDAPSRPKPKPWLRYDNEELWTRII
jgi:hypothetical protein